MLQQQRCQLKNKMQTRCRSSRLFLSTSPSSSVATATATAVAAVTENTVTNPGSLYPSFGRADVKNNVPGSFISSSETDVQSMQLDNTDLPYLSSSVSIYASQSMSPVLPEFVPRVAFSCTAKSLPMPPVFSNVNPKSLMSKTKEIDMYAKVKTVTNSPSINKTSQRQKQQQKHQKMQQRQKSNRLRRSKRHQQQQRQRQAAAAATTAVWSGSSPMSFDDDDNSNESDSLLSERIRQKSYHKRQSQRDKQFNIINDEDSCFNIVKQPSHKLMYTSKNEEDDEEKEEDDIEYSSEDDVVLMSCGNNDNDNSVHLENAIQLILDRENQEALEEIMNSQNNYDSGYEDSS